MAKLDVESVDLAKLVDIVRECDPAALMGAIAGRTTMRDAIAAELGCSLLEAEELVDTMVGRNFLRLERAEGGIDRWMVP